MVASWLAMYARNVIDEIVWIKEFLSPNNKMVKRR